MNLTDCLCESEFPATCGPECRCRHHGAWDELRSGEDPEVERLARNPYLLDDSDSQWAELEARVTRISQISRPYWRAIDAEERERILRAIPDGHRLHITPGHRAKPGTADVSLRTADNQTVLTVRGYITAQRCWAVLPRVVYTTDAAGNVTDIEVES